MTIDIIYYTDEKNRIKNVNALDFDGETGELHVQGDNGKVIKYRMVKEVQVLWVMKICIALVRRVPC